MSKAKPDTRVAYRNSGSGQFETKQEAAKHPRESERQHIPLPTPPKRK